ncbi:hypothetical protein BRADI_2g51435v3 [Brachypodium distachyon]|uniref:Uncharacterized protein n=1 Tax=Brachypodium distachyon TaxID=15368 RepID=A0A0Q3GI33_BRADI|nr:hypothetical protein BRADI_2g51435v3 [Brachypodium distachyon]
MSEGKDTGHLNFQRFSHPESFKGDGIPGHDRTLREPRHL